MVPVTTIQNLNPKLYKQLVNMVSSAMWSLGAVWFKKVLTHHSSSITHHPSLITYHLKYPNSLKVACLAHCFQLLITQFFCTFYGTHTWAPCQWVLLVYPPHTHFTTFSSLLILFCHHHSHSAKVQPKNLAKEPTTVTVPLFLPKIFLQPCFFKNPPRT